MSDNPIFTIQVFANGEVHFKPNSFQSHVHAENGSNFKPWQKEMINSFPDRMKIYNNHIVGVVNPSHFVGMFHKETATIECEGVRYESLGGFVSGHYKKHGKIFGGNAWEDRHKCVGKINGNLVKVSALRNKLI